MTMMTSIELAAAAADPNHPKHHFAWGQLVGIALFGLAGFEGGPAVYASPSFLAQFVAGVSSLFHSPAPAAPAQVAAAPVVLPTGTQLA
jgi:hypothetical protein